MASLSSGWLGDSFELWGKQEEREEKAWETVQWSSFTKLILRSYNERREWINAEKPHVITTIWKVCNTKQRGINEVKGCYIVGGNKVASLSTLHFLMLCILIMVLFYNWDFFLN